VTAGPRALAVDPTTGSLSLGGVLLLALGALDFGLEQSVVVPALPVLADHYDASLVATAWLVTGFLLASVVAVPLLGRLGDMFGKRRLLLVSLGTYSFGALLCALTSSIELAIAGRIIQGLGAATGPLTYALARDTVAPEQLSRAIGVVVGAATAGGGIGFLLSGILVDRLSVTAIFWFLFALPLVLGAAIVVLVPETPVRGRVRIDWVGAGLLSLGLLAMFLAISKGNSWGWSSASILGLFAIAACLLAAFAIVERRVRDPLVDLALVATRPFAEANLCAAAFGYSFFFAVFVIPLIAAAPEDTGFGLGLTTTEIGLVLLPTGAAAALGGWVGGRVVERVGPRALVAVGSVLGIGAYTWLLLAPWTPSALALGSAVLGLCWGLILNGIYSLIVRGADTDKTAVALAVNVVERNTAAALGTQVAFAIVAGAGATVSGFEWTFAMGAIGAFVTLCTAALLSGCARGGV
jgi:MFS family permease